MVKKRKLKIKNIVICVVIVCLLIGGIFLLINMKKSKKDNNTSNNESNIVSNSNSNISKKDYIAIKVGEEVPSVLDYISTMSDSTEIKWDNLTIEDGKAYYYGEYTGKITYDNVSYDVKLKVNDDEAPTVSGIKDITTTEKSSVDFFKDLTITDNSHDKLTKEVSGNYDINKAGTYKLSVVVTDKAGNKTTKEFNLIVKATQVSNTNTNIVGTTSKGYTIEKKNGIYYVNGILIANKSYPLPSSYNPKALTSEFMTAYNKMKVDFDEAGKSFTNIPTNTKINYRELSIKSGYRDYAYQKSLYNNYVNRDGKAAADRYSARPGHSEHQTGLAADLIIVDDNLGNTDSGKWLANNCWKYGFILRYPKGKESETGYMYESWHFRYIGDVEIAKTLYNNGSWLTLEEYLGIDSVYK